MTDHPKFQFQWPFFGNQHIIDFLQTNIGNQSLAHFYIFAGGGDLGKSTLANYFARSILCQSFIDNRGYLPCGECISCQQKNHNDIISIKREEDKQNISIEQVRGFIKQMNLGSFGGKYKIGIIKEAEKLSIEAANALLKILEEPKPGVILILLTSFVDELPDTIISRGQTLYFKPASTDFIYDYLVNNYKAPRDFSRKLARLSAGSPAMAVKYFEDKEFLNDYKEDISALIKLITSDMGEKFVVIEELLKSSKGSELKNQVAYLLDTWQKLIRDLLLLNFNLDYLVTNELILSELQQVKLPIDSLVNYNHKIEQGKKYLKANVNPKIILENLAVNNSY